MRVDLDLFQSMLPLWRFVKTETKKKKEIVFISVVDDRLMYILYANRTVLSAHPIEYFSFWTRTTEKKNSTKAKWTANFQWLHLCVYSIWETLTLSLPLLFTKYVYTNWCYDKCRTFSDRLSTFIVCPEFSLTSTNRAKKKTITIIIISRQNRLNADDNLSILVNWFEISSIEVQVITLGWNWWPNSDRILDIPIKWNPIKFTMA